MTRGLAVRFVLLAHLMGTGPAVAGQLAGSEWWPKVINGVATPKDADLFVQFRSAGRVAGNGGCNRFTGKYRLKGGRIEIGPLAMTRKACPGPIMKRETQFVTALSQARRFDRQRIRLLLSDRTGAPLMRLIQRDAD